MTDTAQQSFTLLDQYGVPIMKGSLPALMEQIPDSVARNRALDDMVRIACDAVEAEELANEARASAIKHFCDGITRLAHRLDQFEKQRAISAKRAEAARKVAAQRQVQRYLDELPDPEDPDVLTYPPPGDLTIHEPKPPMDVGDDGDLEIKHAVDPERYDAGIGDLPPELKEDIPPPSGSYTTPDPNPSGKPEDPKATQQPISASFW
jgi:hypothetical protein